MIVSGLEPMPHFLAFRLFCAPSCGPIGLQILKEVDSRAL